ncbi:MAG: helix-turn-helix domain-containing protein, partial [Wolbachia sp.]
MKKGNNYSNFLYYKVVGQKVRSYRIAKGYTQKDLAKKIGTTYQVILQYEKGTRRISIKKLYELAEALSTTARDLACGQEVPNEERYEEEEILNLVRRHKEIKNQELRETFYLLTKFIRISEEKSGKAVKIEVAKGLVKAGVSAHVTSRTTNLSIDEYDNDEKKISIPYKVGQRIKEWRLRRGYT